MSTAMRRVLLAVLCFGGGIVAGRFSSVLATICIGVGTNLLTQLLENLDSSRLRSLLGQIPLVKTLAGLYPSDPIVVSDRERSIYSRAAVALVFVGLTLVGLTIGRTSTDGGFEISAAPTTTTTVPIEVSTSTTVNSPEDVVGQEIVPALTALRRDFNPLSISLECANGATVELAEVSDLSLDLLAAFDLDHLVLAVEEIEVVTRGFDIDSPPLRVRTDGDTCDLPLADGVAISLVEVASTGSVPQVEEEDSPLEACNPAVWAVVGARYSGLGLPREQSGAVFQFGWQDENENCWHDQIDFMVDTDQINSLSFQFLQIQGQG